MSDNDDAIYVSAVPTAERIAKRVETRAINRIRDRIAKAGMKEEILRLAPSDDEVREEIDMMSLRELSLWIHHNGKRLEKAAKEAAAAAKKQAHEAKKEEEEAKKQDAITRVKARFFNGVRKLNTIADVIVEFKPKRKRKL
jgi:hypothetical protein